MRSFVDVILPLPLDGVFTYLVPEEITCSLRPGMVVRVPFGHRRTCPAVVVRSHNDEPVGYRLKKVLSLGSGEPVLTELQMRLLDWISDYYLCPKGDVMKAMLPSILRPGDDREKAFRPKTETCIRVAGVFDIQDYAGRQREMLSAYLELSSDADIVTKKALLEVCNSSSALSALVSKGVLESWKHEIGRLPVFDGKIYPVNKLNSYQESALSSIRKSFSTQDICLLHGVTSSGKTEVYIHLIKECIDRGGQVLFLLPEIALTLHIMRRLQKVFGNDMCVYHSRCSDAERAEIWNRQLGSEPFKLVVGARSAVFLPFRNLSLTIVDEEHDSSYKQDEPAPRYNARNVAMVLSSYSGAKVLLGSATPSMESYYNALNGKYGLAVMEHRFMDIPLPAVDVVDVYELRRKKRMTGILSPLLENYMRDALNGGNQVILFRNRRGFAPVVHCQACGWAPKCDSCDVNLTWHKGLSRLSCHYCGKTYGMPEVCPECGAGSFGFYGYGTEKVEEEVHSLFPNAITGRLDMDTVSSTGAYEQVLQDFQDGVTNVLIGTQMVSKGLDFERVSVVGILNADSMTGNPDFRSAERAFQMMQQVSGRAGRKYGRGHVVVQTGRADDEFYSIVTGGQYSQFYQNEIEERRLFHYPPFYRIVSVCLKSTDNTILDEAAGWMGNQMNMIFPDRVLGPDAPPVTKVQMQYIRRLMLKIETESSLRPVRERLILLRRELESHYSKVSVHYDVDPM
ncbi:MAG: primosomal protein N' [Bacteroidaceae bacterium]|nr:primosomal protein N' [Bacteroidaceae bacterium]